MQRRHSLLWLTATIVAPRWAHAVDIRLRRVAYLSPLAENDPQSKLRFDAFAGTLRERGWTPGQNIRVDARYGAGDAQAMRRAVREFAEARPDLLVVLSNEVLDIVREEKVALPTLFISVSDPVGSGFVSSLSRPGGNMTGFTNYDPATGAKWLEVLRELVPPLEHVGLLLNTRIAANVALVSGVERAAAGKLTTERLHAHEPAEIDRAFEALAGRRNAGLVVLPNPTNVVNQRRIIELAAKHRVPTIYPFSHMARNGGLIAYGIDQLEQYRAAARYVDTILRGARPGDLPVQQPGTYELAINLGAAKALGLNPSAALRARANELVD